MRIAGSPCSLDTLTRDAALKVLTSATVDQARVLRCHRRPRRQVDGGDPSPRGDDALPALGHHARLHTRTRSLLTCRSATSRSNTSNVGSDMMNVCDPRRWRRGTVGRGQLDRPERLLFNFSATSPELELSGEKNGLGAFRRHCEHVTDRQGHKFVKFANGHSAALQRCESPADPSV